MLKFKSTDQKCSYDFMMYSIMCKVPAIFAIKKTVCMHVTTPLYTHIAVYFTPFLFFIRCLFLCSTHVNVEQMLRDVAVKRHLAGNSGTFIKMIGGCFSIFFRRGGSTERKGLISNLVTAFTALS